MNSDRDIQISFLEWVKSKNPETKFADEIGALLTISKDSAYRRMRGDTLLTFNEIRKISQHFGASLDTFFNLSKDTVLFHKKMLNVNYGYIDFLKSVLQSVKMIGQKESYHMTYIAKDIPPFHYFRFPELSRFKSYFWMRTILKEPTLASKPFSSNLISQEMMDICSAIWKAYQEVPSLEIWSDETFNITLRQIEYSYDTGALSDVQFKMLVDEIRQLLNILCVEAEEGIKKHPDPNQRILSGKFDLYYNEIEIGDNTVFFSMDDRRMVMKTYNMLNLLSTTDPVFCENIEKYIKTILQKSVPISSSSEKERLKFFNAMHAKVNEFEKRVA
jgi:hypothetical protein